MVALLDADSFKGVTSAIEAAKLAVSDESVNSAASKLTYAALIKFSKVNTDKCAPESSTLLKEAVVRTGAYYFGPMFVLNKGTSTPTNKIYKELISRGFYTPPLDSMNNAQLNLFFITLKCVGLVSDKAMVGHIKYGV